MNTPDDLAVEEAGRLAVTAAAADLEFWARDVAVHDQIGLDDLLDVLGELRAASMPLHPAAAAFPALAN